MDQAASLIQELASALEPFAERADKIEMYTGFRTDMSIVSAQMGELRRARSALSKLKENGNG